MPEQTYLLIGAGGIGSETARRVVARGARVVLAGRSKDRVEALGAEVGALSTHEVEASDFDQMAELVQKVVADHGPIHGAVNFAGGIELKPAHLTSFEEFQTQVAQNLTSAFALVRAAAIAMQRGEGGSIVLMSSTAAMIGLPNHEMIAAVKAGVIGLTQSAAATYAAGGVRVNCIAPGLVETPLGAKLTRTPESRKASEAMHPLGRIGAPGDIAPAIDWLLSDESSWVTGQCIAIDGGLSRVKGRVTR